MTHLQIAIRGDMVMDRATAEKLLIEAEKMNRGAWVEHSYHVACLAEKIAHKAGMDSEKAYIYGLLHDIGRRKGNMQARHAIEGYKYLKGITYNDYDKLIQLCDALSLANGYCYAEKKMVNSVIKFGFKDTTINKWKAILELKEYFDEKIQSDVYLLF